MGAARNIEEPSQISNGNAIGNGVSKELSNGVAKENKEFVWSRSPYDARPYPSPPWHTSLMVLFSYAVMISLSILADFLRARGLLRSDAPRELPDQRCFPPLANHFDALYVNNLYRIASDVVNRPVVGVPGSEVELIDRESTNHGWTYNYPGTTSRVVNLGSYNYLGFAHNDGPCAELAAESVVEEGTVFSVSKQAVTSPSQRAFECEMAEFLGVEDAIAFPMGFATNSMNIPALVDKDSLILSDQMNHASIALGCRMSGASIKVFKHNDPADCRRKLIAALAEKNPKTGKPYNKMLIIVEGIYSMEGTIVDLPGFIAVKKECKAYLFLDEAHSIGALGPTGKGVTEYFGVDPRDVDLMMGTLTKSFAGAGGYMAGTKKTIDFLRAHCAGSCYGPQMSPPVIAQVRQALRMISGKDGTDIGKKKIERLLRNTRYFRRRLEQKGFLIYGHLDSPVIPVLTFFLTKVVHFGRESLLRGVGVVSVGYPATPLTAARVRFCVSADHTKEQLDHVLEVLEEVGDVTNTKYGSIDPNPQPIEW